MSVGTAPDVAMVGPEVDTAGSTPAPGSGPTGADEGRLFAEVLSQQPIRDEGGSTRAGHGSAGSTVRARSDDEPAHGGDHVTGSDTAHVEPGPGPDRPGEDPAPPPATGLVPSFTILRAGGEDAPVAPGPATTAVPRAAGLVPGPATPAATDDVASTPATGVTAGTRAAASTTSRSVAVAPTPATTDGTAQIPASTGRPAQTPGTTDGVPSTAAADPLVRERSEQPALEVEIPTGTAARTSERAGPAGESGAPSSGSRALSGPVAELRSPTGDAAVAQVSPELDVGGAVAVGTGGRTAEATGARQLAGTGTVTARPGAPAGTGTLHGLADAIGGDAPAPTVAVAGASGPAGSTSSAAATEADGLDVSGLTASLSRPLAEGNGEYSVAVSLHPPQLGEVRALLSLRGDTLEVTLSPELAAGHEALDRVLPDLRDQLSADGLRVNVSLGEPRGEAGDRNPTDGSRSGPATGAATPDRTTDQNQSLPVGDGRIHLVL